MCELVFWPWDGWGGTGALDEPPPQGEVLGGIEAVELRPTPGGKLLDLCGGLAGEMW